MNEACNLLLLFRSAMPAKRRAFRIDRRKKCLRHIFVVYFLERSAIMFSLILSASARGAIAFVRATDARKIDARKIDANRSVAAYAGLSAHRWSRQPPLVAVLHAVRSKRHEVGSKQLAPLH